MKNLAHGRRQACKTEEGRVEKLYNGRVMYSHFVEEELSSSCAKK
jgi:hypothetical protein